MRAGFACLGVLNSAWQCSTLNSLCCCILLLSPDVCRKVDCPKNHIEHYDEVVEDGDTTTTTKCAKLHFVHHKNERRQGAATLPVASEVVGVLTLLEQASRHLKILCAGSYIS